MQAQTLCKTILVSHCSQVSAKCLTLGAAKLTFQNVCSTRTLCASSSGGLYVKAKSCCESWESAVVKQLQSNFFPVMEDTDYYVTLEVTMPYTKAEFDYPKQAAYKVRCGVHAMSRFFPLPQMRVCTSCSLLGRCDKLSSHVDVAPCIPGCHCRHSWHGPEPC